MNIKMALRFDRDFRILPEKIVNKFTFNKKSKAETGMYIGLLATTAYFVAFGYKVFHSIDKL